MSFHADNKTDWDIGLTNWQSIFKKINDLGILGRIVFSTFIVLLFFLQTTLTFELTYNAPDGSVGMWQKGGFEKLKSDELRQPLSEEERNQLNLEKGSRDSESITSSPNQSFKSSRLSIDSKTSHGKSPKQWVYNILLTVLLVSICLIALLCYSPDHWLHELIYEGL